MNRNTHRPALFRGMVGFVACLLCPAALGAEAQPDTPQQQAQTILEAAGVEGGLLVHLGSGDGRLTAALRAAPAYLVHGLDTDAERVVAARRHIRATGLYGPVSVDTFDGRRLPYADSLVNLLVIEEPFQISDAEITRVLAPRGVACLRKDGQWVCQIKPWPDELDEWTHSLHAADGNPVARDRVVGPPRHLQWTAGPLWARSHGWTPSVSAMVTARGRLFTVCDETLTCADATVPGKWMLTARDAFSGVLLWKRPLRAWGSARFSGTPDNGAGVTTGRFTMPQNVSKRLVAVGDTVYVTLSPTAPVSALDAATGEVRQVYAETARADEILCTGGHLVVSINPAERPEPWPVPREETPPPAPGKQVCAVDIETGRVLWKRGPFAAIRAARGQDPFGRVELCAGDGKVFLLTSETIECLQTESGETLWRIDRPALPEDAVRRVGFAGMYEFLLSVMVYHDGVVLLAQPEPNTHHTYHTMPGTLYAFDAEDGRQMWDHPYGGWGHCTPPDVFAVDDVVWTHVHARAEYGGSWGGGFRARDPSQVDYRIQALDLRSGRPVKELSTKDIFNVGHHHRCHRNRMTERFLMSCRRGVEFVDLATGENYQDHWVRSGCLLGYVPANGLLYVTPHPCECYIAAKLIGFNALAAAREPSAPERAAEGQELVKGLLPGASLCSSPGHPSPSTGLGKEFVYDSQAAGAGQSAAGNRLLRGPAYGQVGGNGETADAADWPTYRHDPQRSGATAAQLDAKLSVAWQTELGTVPGALVAAQGKVLVAGVDDHAVHALQLEDGKPLWHYTTGARVDSPPTVHKGLAVFGSADGRVYCLRASDGALAWSFDAAPSRRLVSAFDQLESAWPVPGSVLVHQGTCWFAAGRSSYLDRGIHVFALDPASGRVLEQQTIYSPDPQTGKAPPNPSANQIPGLLNDIPATDGAGVFIRQMEVWSSEGRRGVHLYTTGGYLDPSWFNRTFWHAGRARTSGLMVLGDGVAYGMEVYGSRSRETVFTPGGNAYRLRAVALKAPPSESAGKQPTAKRKQEPAVQWETRPGIRVTAMVRAGETLFVAGSPDVVDPKDPHGAWEGRKGGVLAAYAASDGEKLAEYKLPAPPVWDGMAAAGGRLLLALEDGTVLCMKAAD